LNLLLGKLSYLVDINNNVSNIASNENKNILSEYNNNNQPLEPGTLRNVNTVIVN